MATLSTLVVKILGDTGQLISALGTAEQRLGQFGKKLGTAGALATRAGQMMTLGVTAPVAGIGVAMLGSAGSYEKSMNIFQAASGATTEQMAAVGEMAVALGADLTLPATSASDAAQAMTELVKGGLSVEDAMAGAKGVLQMSAAGGIANAEAARIAAGMLNAFGLSGKDAVRVADLLAASANSSAGEVTDMADSMRMAGAVYAAAGVPIEALTAMVGEMANKGILGSDAGTSLKQMLLALQTPSDTAAKVMEKYGLSIYDATGKMLPMRNIIAQFPAKLGELNDAERNAALGTIFGSDAVRAANVVLMGGVDAYDKMLGAVTKQGAAADLAAARTKGLGGAWDGLKSALETVLLGPGLILSDWLEGIVRKVAGFVSGIGTLNPTLVAVALVIGGLLAVIGPLLLIFGGMATGISALIALAPILGGILAGVAGVIGAIALPVLAVIAVLALLYLAVTGKLGGVLAWVAEQVPKLVASFLEWAAAFIAWIAPMIPPFLEALGNLAMGVLTWLGEQANILGEKFISDWLPAAIAWIGQAASDGLVKLGELLLGVVNWIGEKAPGIAEKFLGEWVPAAIVWVATALINVIKKLNEFFTGVGKWVVDNAPGFAQTLITEWVPAAILWVAEANKKIIEKLVELLAALGAWIVNTGAPGLFGFAVKLGEGIHNGMVQGLAKIGAALGGAISSALNSINIDIGIFHLHGGNFTVTWPSISWPSIGGTAPQVPGYAAGTSYAPGGLALVGERGPELVNLPRGSRVYDAQDTREMGAQAPLVLELDGRVVAEAVIAYQNGRLSLRRRMGG